MNVGVAPLVVAGHRLQDGSRLLARRARVEVDERPAVDDPLEDREVRARLLVEPHCSGGREPGSDRGGPDPGAAASARARAQSGRGTQRIPGGRVAAWGTL